MKSFVYQVITGERSGAAAGACRWALASATIPYAIAVRARNAWYDVVGSAAHRVALPIVSVGNLTVGGTGKTPCVAMLARFYQSREYRVAILSRGYQPLADGRNDEARELARLVPDALQRQHADRVHSAKAVCRENAADILILDDGFQHRRLHRDLDVVLVDATRPDGFGHLLPRGLLREPLAGLRRAHAIILTRSESVAGEQRVRLQEQLLRTAPQAVWAEARNEPTHFEDSQGGTHPLSALQDKPVAAFCGIGNPVGFQRSLQQAGLRIARFRAFPDHYHFAAADLQQLMEWSSMPPQVAAVICTRKDLVKLNSTMAFGRVPLRALAVEFRIARGGQALESLLMKAARRSVAAASSAS